MSRMFLSLPRYCMTELRLITFRSETLERAVKMSS